MSEVIKVDFKRRVVEHVEHTGSIGNAIRSCAVCDKRFKNSDGFWVFQNVAFCSHDCVKKAYAEGWMG